jgi:PQQ-like domain
MARVSVVAVLTGLTMVVSACAGASSTSPAAASAAPAQPSPSQAAPALSAGAASAPSTAARLPELVVKTTIAGITYPSALVEADGAVWTLGHSDAKWNRIDPVTDTITDSISIGGSYATGGVLMDKKLWALDFTDQQVVALDPATRKVVNKVPVGIDGGWLIAGEGAVWAIGNGAHELTRIDPRSGKVTRLSIDAKCGSTPLAAGGFAWLVADTGHLCKLDPGTGAILGELDGLEDAQHLFWAAKRVVLPDDHGGAVIVDPVALKIEAVVPPPPAGTYKGSKYSLSSPNSQETVSMLDDDPSVWVRYFGSTVGRLDLSGDPRWTVYAGLPDGNDGAPMLIAFGAFWAADVDGGAVVRTEIPAR